MNLTTQLRRNMISFYELPIPFWEQVLGQGLHFHLGHFPTAETSLAGAMRIAVESLATQVSVEPVRRVLDLGCGWGGPAFDLARMWNAEIIGLTISKEQTDLVNQLAARNNLPVQARTIDVEKYDFRDIGTFDVVWLCEVLEHIVDRRSLLMNLRNAAHRKTQLAIATNCRSPHVSREALYNEFMGIQMLESANGLIETLECVGWRVQTYEDCSSLTQLSWKLWLENLRRISKPEYFEVAEKLSAALANSQKLYSRGLLRSVQLTAW